MKSLNNYLLMAGVGCLTLGLAPFSPEPHVWEKIRWLLWDQGPGWNAMYIFDFFLHGTPWLVFFSLLGIKIVRSLKAKPTA